MIHSGFPPSQMRNNNSNVSQRTSVTCMQHEWGQGFSLLRVSSFSKSNQESISRSASDKVKHDVTTACARVGHLRRQMLLELLQHLRVSPYSCRKRCLKSICMRMILECSSRIVCIVKLIIDKVGHDLCLKAHLLSGSPPTLVTTIM